MIEKQTGTTERQLTCVCVCVFGAVLVNNMAPRGVDTVTVGSSAAISPIPGDREKKTEKTTVRAKSQQR